MKVIYKIKNILIQQFRYCLESRLIEVMNLKASDSIRINREFDSNVIDESDLQYEKHFDPTISILFGIKID
jgi:hypothetical protein